MGRFVRTLGALAGLAGFAACGGQTGEGDPADNVCRDEPAERLGDTEQSVLGFAAPDVLEFAREQRIRLSQPGATGATLSATLQVRPLPGHARFIPTRQSRDIGMPEQCVGRMELEVDVELSVTTPAGDQTLRAAGTLTADSVFRAQLTAAFGKDAFELLRAFEPMVGEELHSLNLRAQLTPAGSSGVLEAQLERLVRVGPQPEPQGDAPQVGDHFAQRVAEVAHWPASSACAPGELPIERDQSLFGLAPEDVVKMLTAPKTLRWRDGATTTLKIEAAPNTAACMTDSYAEWFSPIYFPPIPPENPAYFGVPLELSVSSEDGRFARRISTVLHYQARKSGGLELAWIAHHEPIPPGDTGGWSTDVDDDATDRSTTLHLSWPSKDRAVSQLLLHGPPQPDPCGPTTRMCLGTPGIRPMLLGGTIE